MTCVLVVGNHRSGTSLTSRMLVELGVDMNPTSGTGDKGTWEDKTLQVLHEKAIGDWKSPFPNFVGSGVYDHYVDHLAWRRDVAKGRVWGFKDPRLCFFLIDVYDLITWEFGEVVKVINIYRHNILSAKSLVRMNPGLPMEEARAIIEAYHSARMRNLKKIATPRIDLYYDNIIEDTRNQVMRIANFLDIPFNDDAVNIVNPELRHFK